LISVSSTKEFDARPDEALSSAARLGKTQIGNTRENTSFGSGNEEDALLIVDLMNLNE
jgi:hypothetical protein